MLKSFIRMSLAILLVFLLISQSVSAAPVKSVAVAIKFKSASQTIQVGNSFPLSSIMTVAPKVKVSYSSSNPKLASIDANGVVKGITKGEAVLTVTVAQQGYSGKGNITFLINEAPVKTVSNVPVTYKDLTLLDKDVRTGILALFKKDYTNLTAAEKEQRQKLLNINRNQLIAALHKITISANPSWAPAMVYDFEKNNLEDNITEIASLFTSSSDNSDKQAAVDMLKVFDPPKAIDSLATLLSTSTDANLRYSLCYMLSKFKNSDVALSALISLLKVETNQTVVPNCMASAVLVANTNAEQIKKLLLSYNSLTPEKKTVFIEFLNYSSYKDLYVAWKQVILSSQQSSDANEKAAADEIWDAVKTYSPYKD